MKLLNTTSKIVLFAFTSNLYNLSKHKRAGTLSVNILKEKETALIAHVQSGNSNTSFNLVHVPFRVMAQIFIKISFVAACNGIEM